jgi:hypothetical protein
MSFHSNIQQELAVEVVSEAKSVDLTGKAWMLVLVALDLVNMTLRGKLVRDSVCEQQKCLVSGLCRPSTGEALVWNAQRLHAFMES